MCCNRVSVCLKKKHHYQLIIEINIKMFCTQAISIVSTMQTHDNDGYVNKTLQSYFPMKSYGIFFFLKIQ